MLVGSLIMFIVIDSSYIHQIIIWAHYVYLSFPQSELSAAFIIDISSRIESLLIIPYIRPTDILASIEASDLIVSLTVCILIYLCVSYFILSCHLCHFLHTMLCTLK